MHIEEKSLKKESFYSLDAYDGKSIWCVQNNADDNISDKIVIIAHGLTGHPNEYLHMSARNYFNEKGYDVLRFAFYWDDNPKNRKLEECTLAIHAKDLNTVIEHAKKSYKKVYVCGHSYGGLTMLFANPSVNAIAFWDPSFYAWQDFLKDSVSYIPTLDMYTLNWQAKFLLGRDFVEEAKHFTPEQANSLAQNVKAPSIVLKGPLESSRRLYDQLRSEREFVDFPQADHSFNKGFIVLPMLEKTHGWFEKHP